MIAHIKQGVDQAQIEELISALNGILITENSRDIIVTSSSIKEIPGRFENIVEEIFLFDSDIQLANINYTGKRREIDLGFGKIGGDTRNTLVIGGPCSVESRDQIHESAQLIQGLGLHVLRAGSFKPRTSPYSFQGLGKKGLALLDEVRKEFNIKIITEAKDSTNIEDIIEYADIIQVGAKAMYDHGILRKCSKIRKPVLLKRGFGTNLQEFVQAAEFILSGGNENVILCERGIRTFENKTRFTLDLCGVSYLKEHTNLPVVLDPSHAIGYAYGVPDLARASMAMGVDGLLIEVHPDPSKAKSDAAQQLDHTEFKALFESLKNVASAIQYNVI